MQMNHVQINHEVSQMNYSSPTRWLSSCDRCPVLFDSMTCDMSFPAQVKWEIDHRRGWAVSLGDFNDCVTRCLCNNLRLLVCWSLGVKPCTCERLRAWGIADLLIFNRAVVLITFASLCAVSGFILRQSVFLVVHACHIVHYLFMSFF